MLEFEVFVDDNFHFADEDERYPSGRFDTLDEAVTKCQEIVEESLRHLYKPSMTARDLLRSYCTLGDDPWVKGGAFSARHFARERCAQICAAMRAQA